MRFLVTAICFTFTLLFRPITAEKNQLPGHYSPEQCYVTICSEGNQLGGQLTSYAVVLGYAWKHGLQPYFNKEKLLNVPGGSANYELIFHRLPQELAITSNPNHPKHLGFYHPNSLPPYTDGNLCFCGMPDYPLTFFHPYRERIRQLYAASPEIAKYLTDKYGYILEHPKTVAVHVRTYSPKLSIHWCLGKEYFERAMNQFSNDHLFVIFSDRIDWCKDHLNLKGKQVIFIEGNSHVTDLYLISFCKNIIISNSTFSWWGAYLKQSDEGIILAPEKWFSNENPAYRKTFYPSNYTIFPVKSIPAPTDELYKYKTTSLGD